MRIDERIASSTEPSFSFEFFPPKTDEGERNLGRALAELSRLDPTFVSVTYGAGGSRPSGARRSTSSATSSATTAWRRWRTSPASAPPRPSCARCSTDARGGRGERPRPARRPAPARRSGPRPRAASSFSRELIELIRDEYDFAIGAACFPEVHLHATDAESDLRYLKEKVDAGARFLITQLFFDNRAYYDFVARAREFGIDVPIIPGIWPITIAGQIKRVTEMCGAKIPAGLQRELELRGDQPGSVADLGVAYATLQCADLLANGAPGHPLLHAQPLAGDAGDPHRAAAHGAVARRRGRLVRRSSRSSSWCATRGWPAASHATSTWSSLR